jgi:hypothetical protein
VLWSRTITDLQADFRGVADDGGNLYWVEYKPRTPSTPVGPVWLVSVDSSGRDRYRAPISGYSDEGPRVFLASGKFVIVGPGMVWAYEAATGAPSWTIDLSASWRYPNIMGAADLGDGHFAFALSNGSTSTVYLASLSTGAIVWSGSGMAVAASNGTGSAVVVVGYSGSYDSQGHYQYQGDVMAIDGNGAIQWQHTVAGYPSALFWNDAPWIPVSGVKSPSSRGDYIAVPGSWFSAVAGSSTAFAFSFGDAQSPDLVNVVQGGAIAAQGPVAGSNGYNGLQTLPFVAGEKGDHMVLVAQVWHGCPCLCHPEAPGAASIARFDAVSSWQCPLQFSQQSAISGAAMLPGSVVVGHYVFEAACGSWYHVQPVTIEAFSLPGESLAPSGWVQAGGSPGLGQRPLRR